MLFRRQGVCEGSPSYGASLLMILFAALVLGGLQGLFLRVYMRDTFEAVF